MPDVNRWMIQIYDSEGNFVHTFKDYADLRIAERHAESLSSMENTSCFVYFYNRNVSYLAQLVSVYINGEAIRNQEIRRTDVSNFVYNGLTI